MRRLGWLVDIGVGAEQEWRLVEDVGCRVVWDADSSYSAEGLLESLVDVVGGALGRVFLGW